MFSNPKLKNKDLIKLKLKKLTNSKVFKFSKVLENPQNGSISFVC